MNPLSILFLLFSTAGAFSPAALPRTSQHHAIGTTSSVVGGSVNNVKQQPLPTSSLLLRNGNTNGNNFRITPSSLAMSTTAAAASIKADRQFNYKKRVAILMAFMTGWADFIFIKKYNFFATMMTGNSMKMANALVDGRIRDTFFFLTVITSYISGVGAFRRAELSYKDKALNGLFAPIVVGAFVFSDYLSWVNPACKFIPAALLSFAWGIINSVGSEVTGTLIFVVTGAMVSRILIYHLVNDCPCLCYVFLNNT
ncbi:hypothetical protein ACHAXR_001223 [Thalassiosira sp. AJA248-18]